MAVSASGSSLALRTVRRLAASVLLLAVVLGYLYGPPAAPATREAAISACNRHAQGNERSFRLTWHVGVYPHWTCWDASRPAAAPVSLGWWAGPVGHLTEG